MCVAVGVCVCVCLMQGEPPQMSGDEGYQPAPAVAPRYI